MSREPRVPNISRNTGGIDNGMQVNYSSAMPMGANYGGVEPRPSYMSIYDNSNTNTNTNIPMPTMAGKDNFNDINQAFTVSDTVNGFMNRGYSANNSNTDNNNNNNTMSLLTEDNDCLLYTSPSPRDS